MTIADKPDNEDARLAELERLDILDTAPEQAYDDITLLATQICGTPVAMMTLVDEHRQWYKSKRGTEVAETPRDIAFCAHAILHPDDLLIVPDMTADDRFADNPLVTGDEGVRFYAGVPLTTTGGHVLGTLCVVDRVPRTLTSEQVLGLRALSRQVMNQLDMRRHVAALEAAAEERDRYQEQLEDSQLQLEKQMEIVAEQSITDPLTGLRNRRAFLTRLDEEIDRSKRHGTEFALAMIDVDEFKLYNDTFGHAAGDVALCQISDILKAESRASDLVARYGGEEFVAILSGTDTEGAAVLGERYRRAVEAGPWADTVLTVSVGVASTAGDDADIDALMVSADEALYRAKAGGRNMVVTAF